MRTTNELTEAQWVDHSTLRVIYTRKGSTGSETKIPATVTVEEYKDLFDLRPLPRQRPKQMPKLGDGVVQATDAWDIDSL